MYTVITDDQTQPQLDALPTRALAPFAELRATLEVAPWNGNPYNQLTPDTSMRTHTFGPSSEGLVVYLILEDQRRVDLVNILWVD